jgi:nucleotide-binding universal stress UspA family protein
MNGGTGRVPRLIVGISRSRASWWALDWAVGEARRRGARLLLVHVFRPPVFPSPDDVGSEALACPGTRTPSARRTVPH